MAKNSTKPAPAQEEQVEEEGATFEEEAEDAGLTVNLSDVDEAGNFVVLPRGIYPCTLSDLTYETSKAGNKMWSWTWDVEEGHEYAGKKFFSHTTFNEGGLPRVKKALARIQTESGIEKTLLTSNFNPEKVALEGSLLGARAGVRVDIKPYEGKPRNNVRDILPPQGGEGGDGSFLGS